MTCHICEAETEFTCDQCKKPVCEDCCVQPTIHNQIDYPLCTDCQDINDAADWDERIREWERQKAADKKKTEAAAKRKANYYKPENVEKRRLAKLERQRLKREAAKKQLASLAEAMSAFKGMF